MNRYTWRCLEGQTLSAGGGCLEGQTLSGGGPGVVQWGAVGCSGECLEGQTLSGGVEVPGGVVQWDRHFAGTLRVFGGEFTGTDTF